MKLTPQQVNDLLKVLDKYTWTFLAHHVGGDMLTREQKNVLKGYGIDVDNITGNAYNVEHGFKFGILSDTIGDGAAKKMTYSQLKSFLDKGKFGISAIEKAVLQSLKFQTVSEITRLGEKVKDGIKDMLVQADKKRHTVKHTSIVTDAAKKAVEDKRYVKEVVSEIGKATGEWNRDLGRISDFVLHQAFDEGRAAAVVRENGDFGLVFKDVYPGACQYCIRLYLTGGVGSMPKIFTVAELRENATNVGRKVNDWKPVIGASHPYCRCTINKAPEGMTIANKDEWEWTGLTFKRPAKERRERPKAKVTIGNKIVEV